MADVVRLLPDSVANQIAAGEVVQRPASVVKELVENAVDAGAGHIRVVLKNVGKASIQVIDDGKGMSPADARMAFERHATSKIASAQDLFHIHTLGFRGEALPSIASVSEVELRTRREGEELGTVLCMAASELKSQEKACTPKGTNITVKNLFYNIPARRKFLKSDATELRNVTNEFLRVALTHPEIAFSLENNGTELYDLPATGLRQRIVHIFGKASDGRLISVECDTSLVGIKGFVSSPEYARKTYGEQYFFVNNRFMKHPFFHKAVLEAYEGLIGADSIPSYFLYLTVEPSMVDVNIHPTKTEIKFQNESDFFQILLACIREALGKLNLTPPLDFDTEGKLDYMEPQAESQAPFVPRITYDPGYNPFHYPARMTPEDSDFEHTRVSCGEYRQEKAPARWDALFDGVKEEPEAVQSLFPGMEEPQVPGGPVSSCYFQMKGRYIVTPVQSGLMLIDQKRAHERVLFDKYAESLSASRVAGQKSLFPEVLELSASDFLLLQELLPDLEMLGFELNVFGKQCYAIQATPPDLPNNRAKEVLVELVEHYKNTEGSIRDKARERVALALAKAAAVAYGTALACGEMAEMAERLFACRNHRHTADGKVIVHLLKYEDVNNWFK